MTPRYRPFRRIIAAASLCFCTGCASVDVYHEDDRTICEVSDTSWYLLDVLPIASGDTDRPNERACRYLTDTVSATNNLRLIDWARRNECADEIGPVQNRWDAIHVVPYMLQRYTLKTDAELKYEEGRPIPPHACIGSHKRKLLR